MILSNKHPFRYRLLEKKVQELTTSKQSLEEQVVKGRTALDSLDSLTKKCQAYEEELGKYVTMCMLLCLWY